MKPENFKRKLEAMKEAWEHGGCPVKRDFMVEGMKVTVSEGESPMVTFKGRSMDSFHSRFMTVLTVTDPSQWGADSRTEAAWRGFQLLQKVDSEFKALGFPAKISRRLYSLPLPRGYSLDVLSYVSGGRLFFDADETYSQGGVAGYVNYGAHQKEGGGLEVKSRDCVSFMMKEVLSWVKGRCGWHAGRENIFPSLPDGLRAALIEEW